MCIWARVLPRMEPVCEVVHQLGLLLVKDSGHEVGTVLGSLTGPKVVHYLTPMWVASHSDEIRVFFLSSQ